MNREEIYEAMYEGEQEHVKLVTSEGKEYTGYIDVFESRSDNEEDDPPFTGMGSICFYPDEGEPMLLYEVHIASIEIVNA